MTLTGDPYDGMSLGLCGSVREVVDAARGYEDRLAAGVGPYRVLGSLREAVVTLNGALGSVGRTLVEGTRSGKLTTVEGAFVGDAIAASVTARRWIEQARTGLALTVVDPLEAAHIAISGIAEP